MINILLIILIQAIYDFVGWNLILHEPMADFHYYSWREWLFRIIKETLDFPVTVLIMLYLGFSWKIYAGLYVCKWFGCNDLAYMGFAYATKGQKIDPLINWMWWTPLAIITEHKYKATITREAMLIQAVVGVIIAVLLNILF